MHSPFVPLRFGQKTGNSEEREDSTTKVLNGRIESLFEEEKSHDLKPKRGNKIATHPYKSDELNLPPINSTKF